MPWMDLGSIIGMIAMGSFITIIYAEYRSVPNSVRWLKRTFPGRGAGWYGRVDFLLTWFEHSRGLLCVSSNKCPAGAVCRTRLSECHSGGPQ